MIYKLMGLLAIFAVILCGLPVLLMYLLGLLDHSKMRLSRKDGDLPWGDRL